MITFVIQCSFRHLSSFWIKKKTKQNTRFYFEAPQQNFIGMFIFVWELWECPSTGAQDEDDSLTISLALTTFPSTISSTTVIIFCLVVVVEVEVAVALEDLDELETATLLEKVKQSFFNNHNNIIDTVNACKDSKI